MKPAPLNLLLLIAQNPHKQTAAELAAGIGVSQQTVSRWLSQLTREGFVEKTPPGCRLTNEALRMLSKLSTAVEKAVKRMEIRGTVVRGFGYGAYYMSLEGYKKQIQKKLGFLPYPGTLNLTLSGKTDLENSTKLHAKPGIEITGFKHEGRFLGGAKCFKAKINDKVEGAVVIPDRTHHDVRTLEVIAPQYLRATLGLKNNSTLRVLLENE